MRRILSLNLVLALAGLAAAGSSPGTPPARRDGVASPDDDARALAARVIADQHRNDVAGYEFERVARYYQRNGPRILEDKTYRVVPTGTGTLKLLVKEEGRPVDRTFYQKQLRDWEQVLSVAVNPKDPREKQSEEKMRKSEKDRADLVDAARDAFLYSWQGREIQQGRTLVKLGLEPNPAFRPRSSSADLLTHVRATIWVDENEGQLVRANAHIIRDIAFGGGILGKIYRGGRFQMEQAEVAPGVWLPTRFQYDFSGRKFFFGFEMHQSIELSRYRRLGPPIAALAIVRSELATGQSFSADP